MPTCADIAARGNVILGKLEGNNPAGSVKDRPAINMIRQIQSPLELLVMEIPEPH